MIIDFHNHFYPDGYLNELKKPGGYARVETDQFGRMVIAYEGDYNVVVGPHVTVEDRLAAMKKAGVEFEVLSLTTPGVERETKDRGVRLARLANDGFARLIERMPESFTALAALPMQSPTDAVDELRRSMGLGLRGATLFSNVGGRPLDSPEFFPIFEEAARLDAPLFIHPTSPTNSKSMEEFRLVPIIGFGVDTSLAVLRLVLSGVLERLPGLRLVVAHTGGVFPYLRGRIEAAYKAYPETRSKIPRPPSEYLRRLWLDTVCYETEILRDAVSFCGASKLVLGSDFPHQIGDLDMAVRRVRDIGLSEPETASILGDNAASILRL